MYFIYLFGIIIIISIIISIITATTTDNTNCWVKMKKIPAINMILWHYIIIISFFFHRNYTFFVFIDLI